MNCYRIFRAIIAAGFIYFSVCVDAVRCEYALTSYTAKPARKAFLLDGINLGFAASISSMNKLL
jgi:hypothetical protein